MKKRYPPSRARYDKAHPTVAVRVSETLKGELKELQRSTGKSLGDVLREALGKQKRAADGAYRRGFSAAKARYCVEYSCGVCGGIIELEEVEAKKVASDAMVAARWGHSECHRGA